MFELTNKGEVILGAVYPMVITHSMNFMIIAAYYF